MASLLIVDDDPRVRELAEFAARTSRLFTPITSVDDGQAALEHLRAMAGDYPDVILTDLTMPRMDGLQFVRELRHTPAIRDIPVVMFSSSNRANDAANAIAAGCQLFRPKPLTVSGLIELMHEVHAVSAHLSPAHA